MSEYLTPAMVVSTAEIKRWLDQRDTAGPAYTGGPAWKKFMALILRWGTL